MPIVLPWEGNKPTFDQLLLIEDWSEEVLRELIRRRVQESLHLEYKDGLFVEPRDSKGERRDAAGELRRYVAGFANADGGALVVGVAEDSKEQGVPTGLSPITWKHSGGLLNWMRTSLSSAHLGGPNPLGERHQPREVAVGRVPGPRLERGSWSVWQPLGHWFLL